MANGFRVSGKVFRFHHNVFGVDLWANQTQELVTGDALELIFIEC